MNLHETVQNADLTFFLAEPDENEFAADVPRDPKSDVDHMKCMSSQFSQLRFLHTCSGLRFLASEATFPEHRICVSSVLLDASKFVADFEEILTEVGKCGEIQIWRRIWD